MKVDCRYAWTAGPRWVWWYAKRGKIVAAIRTIYWTLIRGNICEACQECGNPYPHWHADDALYERVTGRGRYANGESAPGLFCLHCFDRKAEQRGITLQWNPSDIKEFGLWDEVVCIRRDEIRREAEIRKEAFAQSLNGETE
jgi:hypothetical protein